MSSMRSDISESILTSAIDDLVDTKYIKERMLIFAQLMTPKNKNLVSVKYKWAVTYPLSSVSNYSKVNTIATFEKHVIHCRFPHS